MAYTKTVWKDRVVEKPRNYTKTDNTDGTITLTPAPGVVTEAGTPIIAANLNNMEEGIASAHSSMADMAEMVSDNRHAFDVYASSTNENFQGINLALAQIVQQGSNANGNYVRYSDGTQICYKKINITGVTIDKAWGSLYESAASVNFGTWPIIFLDVPVVNIIPSNNGAACFLESLAGKTTSNVGASFLARPNVATTVNLSFDVIGIGRWK